MPDLPWIIALTSLALLLLMGLAWLRFGRRRKALPLPAEWALAARPVFTSDERRVFHLLREALPHHIVLSKLPLVRFCQPNAPGDVRYWYELLGSIHVAFAVCSANGRVLAAIDLDTERGNSRRIQQIKQSVLGACRVRYLRCPADRLPSVAELQLLVPQGSTAPRAPQPARAAAHNLHEARDSLASTVAHRRAERTALWQDSTIFQDSFFAADTRSDGFGGSEFGALSPASRSGHAAPPMNGARPGTASAPDRDIAGVVVDSTDVPTPSRH